MTRLATDPPTSEAQRRAMWAAASGHSNIGIPKSVGSEFAEADPGGKLPARAKDMTRGEWGIISKGMQALMKFFGEEAKEPEHQQMDVAGAKGAGVAFMTNDGRALFLKRGADSDHPGTWCFPGGHVEDGEDPLSAAQREAREEVGDCGFDGMKLVDCRAMDGATDRFATYGVDVPQDWRPTLDKEHTAHVWAGLDSPPEPLHPGVKATLDMLRERANDAWSEEARAAAVEARKAHSAAYKHHYEQSKTHTDPEARKAHGAAAAMHQIANHAVEHPDWKYRDRHSNKAWAASKALGYGKDDAPDPHGALSETTRERIGSAGSEKREDMPEGVFLGPDRTYPVKQKEDGEWKYTRPLLEAAAKRARMQGRNDIAKRADAIRVREFGGGEGEDDWSPEARKAAAEARRAKTNISGTEATHLVRGYKPYTSAGKRNEEKPGTGKSISKEELAKYLALRKAKAMDWATPGRHAARQPALAFDRLPLAIAEDREAGKYTDDDGRLHVDDATISRAVINPYLGKEINEVMRDEPGWRMLEPERKYMLLRDPEEMRKSVDTWNGLPVLWDHMPTSARDHPADKTIGSTGTNARFDDDSDLKNDLVIWPEHAIKAIDSGAKKELSCGYGYRADMTPGEHKGQRYDGVMRDIRGNHVAIVPKGRVGAKAAIDAAIRTAWARPFAA